MRIIHDYPGANIEIVEAREKEVLVKTEIKDSMEWWFHWSFAVEDAIGEITFQFIDDETIGYWGPAVSFDGTHWDWLGASSRINGKTFVFDFKDNTRVYFAFSMQYQLKDFDRFCQSLNKSVCNRSILTKSKQGREVPLLQIGDRNAENHILLSARHHACESTGSYALEGVLREFAENPIPNYLVSAMPFTDIDGVENGDQGKSRAPHDHNRDYIENPIFQETKAWMEYAKDLNVKIAIDFHSPWRWAERNDEICFIKNDGPSLQALEDFSDMLEQDTKDSGFKYHKKNNFFIDYLDSDQVITTCAGYFSIKPVIALSTGLEMPYFGVGDHIISQENMIGFGRVLALALRKYIENHL